MRIAVCGDVHMCKNSSLIRGRGEKYSQRLENCIESINWFEELSQKNKCDVEVFLGDFFDSPMLDDETLTATKDIRFNKEPIRIFIVGNHESSVNGLYYNSVSALKSVGMIVSSKASWKITEHIALDFVPYILETDREPLFNYLDKSCTRHIVFSHNDIAGIQMGAFLSKTGFTVDEIEKNCELFINGHLHNHGCIGETIINLGNITGQNFGEDATKYDHCAMIVDIDDYTEDVSVSFYRNPKAFNFYKFEIDTVSDLDGISLKPNAVVAIKCFDDDASYVKQWLTENNVAESRVTLKTHQKANERDLEIDTSKSSIDHLTKFVEASIEKFGNSDILQEELAEIVRAV